MISIKYDGVWRRLPESAWRQMVTNIRAGADALETDPWFPAPKAAAEERAVADQMEIDLEAALSRGMS